MKNELVIKNKTPLKYNARLSNNFKSNIFFKEEHSSIGQSYKYRLINDIIKNYGNDVCIICYPLHIKLFAEFLNKNKKNIYIYLIKSTNRIKNKYNNVTIHDNDITINKTIEKALTFCKENNVELIDTIFNPNNSFNNIYNEINNQLGKKLPIDYVIVSGCHYDILLSTLNFFKSYENTTVICTRLSQQKKIINTNYAFPTKKHLNKYKNYKVVNINEEEYIDYIIDTYINDSYIMEYTSALVGSSLKKIQDLIIGKNVVCIINDNNNNIDTIINILNKYKTKSISSIKN